MPRTRTSEKARVRRGIIKAFTKAQSLLYQWAGRYPGEGAPQREVKELLDRAVFIINFWASYESGCPALTVIIIFNAF